MYVSVCASERMLHSPRILDHDLTCISTPHSHVNTHTNAPSIDCIRYRSIYVSMKKTKICLLNNYNTFLHIQLRLFCCCFYFCCCSFSPQMTALNHDCSNGIYPIRLASMKLNREHNERMKEKNI